MPKPYYFSTKTPNGNIYVQLRLPDGSLTNQKSTGTSNKAEAERIAMTWIVNGGIPKRINSAKPTEKKLSLEKINIVNALRTTDFSEDDIKSIVGILKQRKYILSAVVAKTPESRPIDPYLKDFWDFDKSDYIRERNLRGHSVHKSYCATMQSRVNIYWLPRLSGKSIGEITVDDVNGIFEDEKLDGLAPKTINSIISAITIPMKWAYHKRYTQNDCFTGIVKCAAKSKSRKILTMEQAMAVFRTKWENEAAKLANILAMYTGMRAGEIAGLRVEDIGKDRLYVRHSWSKFEGIKSCKNGEEREVPIAPQLRDALLAQASLNPYNEGIKSFVFFGLKPSQPTDNKRWNKYLHRAHLDTPEFKELKNGELQEIAMKQIEELYFELEDMEQERIEQKEDALREVQQQLADDIAATKANLEDAQRKNSEAEEKLNNVEKREKRLSKLMEIFHKLKVKLRSKGKSVSARETAADNREILFNQKLQELNASIEKINAYRNEAIKFYEGTSNDVVKLAKELNLKTALDASRGNNPNKLMSWFKSVETKFSSWFYTANYVVQKFFNKSPDEMQSVVDSMRKNKAATFGQFVDMRMHGQTAEQIAQKENLVKKGKFLHKKIRDMSRS